MELIAQLFTVENLLMVILGTVVGMTVGALPGLGATVGMAIMLPLCFELDYVPSLILLMCIYMSASYGGSISSVLLGVPGTPSAAATVLDGFPMSKQGKPGLALGYSLYSSTIGGFFGVLILVTCTKPLSSLCVHLSDPEMFVIALLGILSVPALGSKNGWRCALTIFLGLLLGTVGLDSFTGALRYSFGNVYISDGLSLVTMLAGLYALTECFEMGCGDLNVSYVTDTKNLKCSVPAAEYKKVSKTVLVSSTIGMIFGAVPGLGNSASSWFAYAQAKRTSKNPELFEHGSPEGIAAAESANNAAVGGGLIPALALGIPGTSGVALMMSVLMMKGVYPGPNLYKTDPMVITTVYVGLFISVIAMFFFGKYMTTAFAQVLRCKNYVLIPIIITAVLAGAYVARSYPIDIWITIITGAVVFFLKRLDFSVPAFAPAFILAGILESRFRRSLYISTNESLLIFFTRPVAIGLWVLLILMFVLSARSRKARGGKQSSDDFVA